MSRSESYALNLNRLKKEREPIVDQCKSFNESGSPCQRIDGEFCSAAVVPSARWRLGPCNLATHVVARIEDQSGKVRVGQQKQKKKARK